MIGAVQERRIRWLPMILIMVVAAVTRTPELMPPNFSAMIALAFCAGVYFPGALGWLLPMTTMLATDLLLNQWVYGVAILDAKVLWFMAANYAVFLLVILLGRKFSRKASFTKLLGGGLLGALLFYLVTNTVSWLVNPAYLKTLAGWIQSLTVGLPGYPPTWSFLLNTLLSSGLFTGLFAAAMKLSAVAESAVEKDAANQPAAEEDEEPEAEPDESKA